MSRTPRKELVDLGVGSLEELLRGVTQERDELAQEVRQLTRYQDTSSMWQQFGATTRELRRAEEELVLLRQAEASVRAEQARTAAQCEELRERVLELETRAQQQGILVTVLREELRKSSLVAVELESAVQRLRGELNDCRRALALREEVCLRLESQRRELLVYSVQASQTSPPPSPGTGEPPERVAALSAKLAETRRRLDESERSRRELQNTVHELKGNVRVMARVRPPLPGEEGSGCLLCHPDGQSLELSGESRGAGQVFSLDRVFGPEADQEKVFGEVADLVQSAVDGYKVCLLSYGQTGSGKTHTMTGAGGAERGIVPRAVESLLSRAQALTDEGSETDISLSIVEIYNETFRDLLSDGGDGDKVKVALTGEGVLISGLSSRRLDSNIPQRGLSQFSQLLSTASSARSVASTLMNESSSRSHMVFMLDLRIRHSGSGETFLGGLRFVDLAGSERLERTGTGADARRLRETVNINKSLSCLGDVFSAIGSKQSHGNLS